MLQNSSVLKLTRFRPPSGLNNSETLVDTSVHWAKQNLNSKQLKFLARWNFNLLLKPESSQWLQNTCGLFIAFSLPLVLWKGSVEGCSNPNVYILFFYNFFVFGRHRFLIFLCKCISSRVALFPAQHNETAINKHLQAFIFNSVVLQ